VDDLQNIVDQLELDKLGASGRVMEIGKEKSAKDKELANKDSELAAENTKLEAKIKEIITKKRAELAKTNIQEFDDKTATGDQDHRKTI
jgi:phosphopentomutase